MINKILHAAEIALVRGLLAAIRALPVTTASNLGGAIARTIGPLLPVSRVAQANLRAALPALDHAEGRRIVRGVWDNLGRNFAEFPHIGNLPRDSVAGPGWCIEGLDVLDALHARGGPVIFVSGHFGNWEMWPRVASEMGFVPNGLIYRAASNKGVDTILTGLRKNAAGPHTKLFPKGAAGARSALLHIKIGGCLLMLVDQKMNDGILAQLFGMPAMSPSALAGLALRFNCPVVPAVCRRIGPARFVMRVEPPLQVPASGDRTRDVAAMTQAVNDRFEAWIREQPDQWLWLHRRWPKDVVKT